MESPKTYHGYDSDDNCITTVTADDATNYINPDEVKQAIDNLEAVLKEIPRYRSNSKPLLDWCCNMLKKHKEYISKYGIDMPYVRDWVWKGFDN